MFGNIFFVLQTIFEIGPKAGSETHKIMQIKRTKDQHAIEKYRFTKRSGNADLVGSFDKLAKKDEENFIPYLPKDHHTETG